MDKKLMEILDGIDRDELDNDGWWETSTGAEFGEGKLKEVLEVVGQAHSQGFKEGEAIGIKKGLLKAVEVVKNQVAPVPCGDSPNKIAHISSWTTARKIADKLEALIKEAHV